MLGITHYHSFHISQAYRSSENLLICGERRRACRARVAHRLLRVACMIHKRPNIQIYKYTNIHTYTYIHKYKHTYKHTYMHAYIRTYVHTYIHTHTHTYMQVVVLISVGRVQLLSHQLRLLLELRC